MIIRLRCSVPVSKCHPPPSPWLDGEKVRSSKVLGKYDGLAVLNSTAAQLVEPKSTPVWCNPNKHLERARRECERWGNFTTWDSWRGNTCSVRCGTGGTRLAVLAAWALYVQYIGAACPATSAQVASSPVARRRRANGPPSPENPPSQRAASH